MKQEQVTAENLTDEQIREEMAHYAGAETGGISRNRIQECERALRAPVPPHDEARVEIARIRVASLINARHDRAALRAINARRGGGR